MYEIIMNNMITKVLSILLIFSKSFFLKKKKNVLNSMNIFFDFSLYMPELIVSRINRYKGN